MLSDFLPNFSILNNSFMCTRLFVFFLAFALFACSESADPDPSDPETEIEADFTGLSAIPGSGRRSAFSFAIGNKVYVGAGFGRDASGQTYLADFWEYDVASNTWTEKAPFPLGPFFGQDAFAYNGKGYVFFGGTVECSGPEVPCDHIEYNYVHAYDPASDTWQQVADLSSIPGLRDGHATLIGDKVFFVTDNKAFEISLLDFSYTDKAAPPVLINFAAFFRIGDKIYYMTGMDNGLGNKQCVSYDLVNGTWELLPDFPEKGRYDASGFAMDGYGYLIGGKESDFFGKNQRFRDVWQFEPKGKTWKKIGDYPGSGFTLKVLEVLGEKVYLGLGDEGNGLTFGSDWWVLEMK